MEVTKLSQDFTPLNNGVFFEIDTTNDTPSDLIVEIVEAGANEVVATQLLREVISAKVNIAPYISHFSERMPHSAASSSMFEAPTATYYVRVGDVKSENIVLSVNGCDTLLPSIISTHANQRHIAYGECDEVLMRVAPQSVVKVNISADNGETLSIEHATISGMVILAISTEDFGSDINSLNIELSQNGAVFDHFGYSVAKRVGKATRLAWLSGKGSIERYTFPVSQSCYCKVEKQYLDTSTGLLMTRATMRQGLSLLSHYEPRATIEALGEIISSPKVWIDENGFREVEVATSNIEYNLFNEPDIVELELCEVQKEVVC